MKLHTFCNDNLRHRLVALQSNTALCDFTFKLHDSTQFSTHKAVVAAFSTTALMLCDETCQVVIPRHDITRDIFQIVLNFIYGQSIVVKDTYMKQLEWLANYLGIEDLSKVLVPFKSSTSNSDVCIEIKEEPIELNDELDVQESTSAMLHNAVFSDTYADDNDIKDEDNEHSAILTKQRQKRHKTSKGKAKTKSSKKRKTDDTPKIKSDNANKELADDKNDDTDIDNEDDINDEMDTGESASNEINDNIENVTTKQEPADSESQILLPMEGTEQGIGHHSLSKSTPPTSVLGRLCTICGVRIKSISGFKDHVAIKHGEPRYICPIDGCNKAYQSKTKFKAHKLIHIEKNFKIFKCDSCEKKYTTKSNLDNHIATKHTLLHKCSSCSECIHPGNMKRHVMAVHEGIRYRCPLCHRDYSYKNTLIRHIKTCSKI